MTATIAPSYTTMIPTGRAADPEPASRRGVKPRRAGLTQIHGPYYNAAAQRRLADELETMGSCIDSLEFKGGPFNTLRPHPLAGVVALCRQHAVAVSAGGLSEHVLGQGARVTDRYNGACRDLGVDIIGWSSSVTTWLGDDCDWLVRRILRAGLEVRPTINLNLLAGNSRRKGDRAIELGQDFVQAGADLVVLAYDGVTDNVPRGRTEVATRLIETLGNECVMLEAPDPDVFTWYVKHCGPEVNLFVDHNHVALLECLRAGLWNDEPGRATALKERNVA